MSSSFLSVVLLISSIIIVYSYHYMSPYSKAPYFLWFTISFILSMLFLISSSDLMFVMLGWDGLGLVSFFLIVYFQNQSSIYSGLFTVLINRLGDAFFLILIGYMLASAPTLFVFMSDLVPSLTIFILLITFCTKSAIFPFSSWLPLAMAAPTPISALVHSSTLVTAGLYLIIRYSYYLYSVPGLCKLIIILGLFTSFYSGLNSISECDFKKLIALSTLSHLGFILTALGSGLVHLAFFHLLSHALFKSLLFIAIGDIMVSLQHSQEARYLSSGRIFTTFSSNIITFSFVNLLGIPSVTGFFSKDLILERFNYESNSFVLLILLYFNLIFTFYYTLKLFYFTFKPSLLNPYQQFHPSSLLHAYLILSLSFLSIISGYLMLSMLFPFTIFPPLPVVIKILPNVLIASVFFYLCVFLKPLIFLSRYVLSLTSSMLFLTPILNSFSFSVKTISLFNKSFEQGRLWSLMGLYSKKVSFTLSSHTVETSLLHSLTSLWSFIPILILVYILL